MSSDINLPIGDKKKVGEWLLRGATTYDGIAYGPPSSAKAWGTAGCPLISRVYRLRYGQQSAPLPLRIALKESDLLVADLHSDVLRQFDPGTLSDALLKSIRDLIYRFPISTNDVALPPGISISWVTALPINNRLRNRLRRFPWPHDWITQEPIWCSQLLTIRGLGKSSLNELLCVLESAELGVEEVEEEGALPVAEMTARILGRVQLGRAARNVSSQTHVREQDGKKHDRTKTRGKVLSGQQDVLGSTYNPSFQKAVNEAVRQTILAGLLRLESLDNLHTIVDEESEVVCSVSALGDLLREFITWAIAETDAQTIGEAISQSMSKTEPPKAWQAIAELNLNQAGYRPEHPYAILESWANQLPEREKFVFSTRIARLGGIPTLQNLGDYFGISRERVRQLEKRVRRKLSIMLKRESTLPIRWRAKTVRQRIGVAVPLASVESLLSSLDREEDFRGIVLELAGPYKHIEGWLVLKSALSSDPTPRIRDMADEIGFINNQLAAERLKEWGLDTALHDDWLMRDGKIRKLNGRLIRWDGSIGDKLVIALTDLGRPASIEALLENIQENRAKTSAANALSIDPRAVRISRKEWALASWGLSKYSSIAMSIRHVLKSQGHPTSVEDVVTRLMKDLGLRENSIRAYCQAPMFILENGAIRLRRDDEPYMYDNVSLQNATGVFALSSNRVSLLFEVDGELLRGRGRSLAPAAGFLLGVALNRPSTFNDQDGLSVTLTFPETSISGPSVGSLRPLAEASGARLGDLLTLTFDKSDKSVTAVATDLAQYESGWQLVSRLTGIDANEGLEGLASALQCGKGEVRAMLAKRGDEVVKDALPNRPVSFELDQALASLEAQLQQTKGSLR